LMELELVAGLLRRLSGATRLLRRKGLAMEPGEMELKMELEEEVEPQPEPGVLLSSKMKPEM
jgi:hypothetical protein